MWVWIVVTDTNNDCLWNKGQISWLGVCWQSAKHAKQRDYANGGCWSCQLPGEAQRMAPSSLQLLTGSSTLTALTVMLETGFMFPRVLCHLCVP